MTSGRREGHGVRLAGMRTVLLPDDPRFPAALRVIPRPPKRLYVLGDPEALTEGLAVVGARMATPYGIGAAKRFARLAAQRGIAVISGGARGLRRRRSRGGAFRRRAHGGVFGWRLRCAVPSRACGPVRADSALRWSGGFRACLGRAGFASAIPHAQSAYCGFGAGDAHCGGRFAFGDLLHRR